MVEYCSPYYLLIHIFNLRLARPTVVSWVCVSVVSLLGPLISGSSAQKSTTGLLFLRGISVKQISALSYPFQDCKNMWKTLTSFQSWSSLRAPASTTPVSCSSRRAPWRLVELSIRQQLSMMPDLGMHSGTGSHKHSIYGSYYYFYIFQYIQLLFIVQDSQWFNIFWWWWLLGPWWWMFGIFLQWKLKM